MIRSGLVGIDYQSVSYKDIQNVDLRVGVADKLLKVGDVYFVTAAGNRKTVFFEYRTALRSVQDRAEDRNGHSGGYRLSERIPPGGKPRVRHEVRRRRGQRQRLGAEGQRGTKGTFKRLEGDHRQAARLSQVFAGKARRRGKDRFVHRHRGRSAPQRGAGAQGLIRHRAGRRANPNSGSPSPTSSRI